MLLTYFILSCALPLVLLLSQLFPAGQVSSAGHPSTGYLVRVYWSVPATTGHSTPSPAGRQLQPITCSRQSGTTSVHSSHLSQVRQSAKVVRPCELFAGPP